MNKPKGRRSNRHKGKYTQQFAVTEKNKLRRAQKARRDLDEARKLYGPRLRRRECEETKATRRKRKALNNVNK